MLQTETPRTGVASPEATLFSVHDLEAFKFSETSQSQYPVSTPQFSLSEHPLE